MHVDPIIDSISLQLLEMEQFPDYKPRHKSQSLGNFKRIWTKVIESISNYKRQNNGLDYSIDFFYHIEKMIEHGYTICLNIPQTLTGAHDNFLQTIFLPESNQDIGKIKLTPSFSKTKFESCVEKSIFQSIGAIKNKQLMEKYMGESEEAMNNRSLLLPFVVMKQKMYDTQYKNSNTILNSYEYKRINSIDASQIVQQYIFTKTMGSSITRFFYEKNPQKSTAFKICNEGQMFESKNKFKDIWKVEQNRQNSCFILKIMYQNKSFYTQTLHLVESFEKFFNKEISSMVSDWVLDTAGRYYLIDVKSVRLVEPKPKYRISKSLSELLSTVTCCMCLQTCNQSQISKILTTKLIINFYEHLKRRGINLSFRINFKKLSNFSRVCDLCYSLVVAETKLIELQKTMSQICNFKQEIGFNSSAVDTSKASEEVQFMNQWRLFFYIEDIKNFSLIFGKDLKQQIEQGGKIYLNLQINDSMMSFQLKPPFANNLVTKIVKIQYVFSDNPTILQFLHEAEVRVQIIIKHKSTKAVAEGCIHGLYNEGETLNNQAFLQRKYKQILLFNEYSKYSILGLYIGLSNDGKKNVSSFKFTKSLSVYRPQNYILDCQSLPTEWMEIIHQNYCSSILKQKSSNYITSDPSIDYKMEDENKKMRLGTPEKIKKQMKSKKSSLFPQLNFAGLSEKRPKLVL